MSSRGLSIVYERARYGLIQGSCGRNMVRMGTRKVHFEHWRHAIVDGTEREQSIHENMFMTIVSFF